MVIAVFVVFEVFFEDGLNNALGIFYRIDVIFSQKYPASNISVH